MSRSARPCISESIRASFSIFPLCIPPIHSRFHEPAQRDEDENRRGFSLEANLAHNQLISHDNGRRGFDGFVRLWPATLKSTTQVQRAIGYGHVEEAEQGTATVAAQRNAARRCVSPESRRDVSSAARSAKPELTLVLSSLTKEQLLPSTDTAMAAAAAAAAAALPDSTHETQESKLNYAMQS